MSLHGIILALSFLLTGVPSAVAACSDLDVAGLKRLVAKKPRTPVVFFASWCSECALHLRQPLAPGTVLIATFDERKAVDAVIKQLGVAAPCYIDQGIAGAYGVKSVPAVLSLDAVGAVVPGA